MKRWPNIYSYKLCFNNIQKFSSFKISIIFPRTPMNEFHFKVFFKYLRVKLIKFLVLFSVRHFTNITLYEFHCGAEKGDYGSTNNVSSTPANSIQTLKQSLYSMILIKNSNNTDRLYNSTKQPSLQDQLHSASQTMGSKI